MEGKIDNCDLHTSPGDLPEGIEVWKIFILELIYQNDTSLVTGCFV